jgi:hypothetical protein
MKKVLILRDERGERVYSTLTSLCREMGWSYNWIKTKKYPFEYRGYTVIRKEINPINPKK